MFAYFALFLESTHPYLDPGSGSFLIQMLLAVGLGISVAVKMYWGKLKSLITGKRPDSQPETVDDEEDDTN